MAQAERLLIGLGIAIREQRMEQRLSQEALSLETGIHRNYIGGVERGERSPTVAIVAKIADALAVPLSELFARAEREA